jgi:putative ABC transport system substrate-binding protein
MYALDSLFASSLDRLAALASHYRIPAIYHQRAAVEKGGLMSYGSGRPAGELPLVGQYTARILKGERPGDLPVQRATTVDFVINLKTAKALGLTIPLTLYARADELVE